MRKLLVIAAAFWALGFIAAVFSPPDILARAPILNAYVNLVSLIFPIELYVTRSTLGDAAPLYNAIVWPSLPVDAAIFWLWMKSRYGKDPAPMFKRREDLTLWNRILILSLAPLWFVIALGGLYAWRGDGIRLFNANSAIQLGLFGMGLPFGSAALFCAGIASIKKAIFGTI